MSIKKYGNLEIEEEATLVVEKSPFRTTARIFLFIVLFLAFMGFTGSGYFSNSSIKSQDGRVLIEYPWIGRFQIKEDLKVTLLSNSSQGSLVTLWLSNNYLQKMYVRQILPLPVRSKVGEDKIFYTFYVTENQPITITFQMEPEFRGLLHANLGIENSYHIRFSQFIFP